MLGNADRASGLRKNRYYADDAGDFVDVDGKRSGYTIVVTRGCSAAQIIDAAGLGKGHIRFGITKSALADWVASIDA
jgi:hypothetical protein